MKDSAHQEKMLSLVSEYRTSGKTQSVFAREHEINVHTFKYWLYKSRQKEDDNNSFIRLDPMPGHQICLRYPNGIEMLVPAQIPFATLRQLINLQD